MRGKSLKQERNRVHQRRRNRRTCRRQPQRTVQKRILTNKPYETSRNIRRMVVRSPQCTQGHRKTRKLPRGIRVIRHPLSVRKCTRGGKPFVDRGSGGYSKGRPRKGKGKGSGGWQSHKGKGRSRKGKGKGKGKGRRGKGRRGKGRRGKGQGSRSGSTPSRSMPIESSLSARLKHYAAIAMTNDDTAGPNKSRWSSATKPQCTFKEVKKGNKLWSLVENLTKSNKPLQRGKGVDCRNTKTSKIKVHRIWSIDSPILKKKYKTYKDTLKDVFMGTKPPNFLDEKKQPCAGIYDRGGNEIQSADSTDFFRRGKTLAESLKGMVYSSRDGKLDHMVNEQYLLHGTNAYAVGSIAHKGFTRKYVGGNAGTMWGRGIYLADDIIKTDQYSAEYDGEPFPSDYNVSYDGHPQPFIKGKQYVFVVRATLGWYKFIRSVREAVGALTGTDPEDTDNLSAADRRVLRHRNFFAPCCSMGLKDIIKDDKLYRPCCYTDSLVQCEQSTFKCKCIKGSNEVEEQDNATQEAILQSLGQPKRGGGFIEDEDLSTLLFREYSSLIVCKQVPGLCQRFNEYIIWEDNAILPCFLIEYE